MIRVCNHNVIITKVKHNKKNDYKHSDMISSVEQYLFSLQNIYVQVRTPLLIKR